MGQQGVLQEGRSRQDRLNDWERELHTFIESRRETKFEWGTHDCVLFAADAVLATTGVDYAAPYRGTYTTAKEAVALLADLGGVHQVITGAGFAQLGSVLLAQRGDVVVCNNMGRPVAGVCVGAFVACAAPIGYTLLPLRDGVAAWRV